MRAGTDRGQGGVQVGGLADRAGFRAPLADRHHAGRDQGQAAEQGGDLGVRAGRDPAGHRLVVRGEAGGGGGGSKVAGHMAHGHEAARG